jgi:DNA repair exonuclease SbcCD ATPase subunit
MQITKLTVENFRALEHIELELAPVAVLFGWNAQGKTCVLNALQWALFGRVPGLTDARGAGSATLIRDGAKAADIAVEVTHDGPTITVMTTINQRGANEFMVFDTATGEVLDALKTREALWSHLGVDYRHAEVAAMPAAFLLSRDLSDILADFCAGNLDPADIQEYMSVHDGWLKEFCQRERIRVATADDLHLLGKRAYERRTEVNRELKIAKSDADTLQATGAPTDKKGRKLTVADIPVVEEKVAQLVTQQRALLAESGAAAAVSDRVAVEEAKNTLPELKAVADALGVEADKLKGQVDEAATAHAAAVHDLNQCRREIEQMKKLGDCCPTCGQAVNVAPLIEDAEAKAKKLKAVADAALKKIQPARDAHKELAERATVAHQAEARARTLAEAPACRAVAVIEEELATVEGQIDNGRGIIEQLSRYQLKESTMAQVKHLEQQSERLTWAVRQFHDGEALKNLVSDALGAFTGRVNEELEDGHSLEARVDGKSIELALVTDGVARPLRLCSAGQQCMVAAAVALAFAAEGGLVLLDDINHLDAHHRRELLLRLRDRQVGTAVLACAWQQRDWDQDAVRAALAPVQTLWLQEGVLA